MRKRTILALAFLFGSLLITTHTYAQAGESEEKLSKESISTSEARSKRILEELGQPGKPDWAGEYYYGDGLGVNVSLTIAPQNGFVFTWTGCLGLYDLNFGDISFSNGTIKLLFNYPNDRHGYQGAAPELLPIQWGERHYLISVDGIIDFANAINAGTEPSRLFAGRSTSFLLKRGDEKKPVSGHPNLPQEYAGYLLKNPIEAQISAVLGTKIEDDCRTTTVTINMGSADGLRQGMELFLRAPSKLYAKATITSIAEHSAQAVIDQYDVKEKSPTTKWKLSTKL
jgi:hypothetical protein